VPTFLTRILEGRPDACKAAESEVEVGLLTDPRCRCGLIERPLVRGTVITLGTGIGLRLEGLAEGRGDVYNLQTDRASGVIGETSKVRNPGEVVTNGETAQRVLVIVIAESNG